MGGQAISRFPVSKPEDLPDAIRATTGRLLYGC